MRLRRIRRGPACGLRHGRSSVSGRRAAGLVAQIVVPIGVLVPQRGLAPGSHWIEAQVAQLAGGDGECRLRLGLRRAVRAQLAAAAWVARWRQPDVSVAMHAQQRHPAAHLLESAVGFAP